MKMPEPAAPEQENPFLTEIKKQGQERLEKIYQDPKVSELDKIIVKKIMDDFLYTATRLLGSNGISLLIDHLKICRDSILSIEIYHSKQENK